MIDHVTADADAAPEQAPATTVRQDLARITLAVMVLLLLIVTTLWILRPFLVAGVWATMLVVSTWPLLTSLQARLGNRRGPAVAVLTVGMLLLVILPLWAAIATIAGQADQVTKMGEVCGGTGLAAAAGLGGKAPRRRSESRGRLDSGGGRRSGGPRRPGGALCLGRREMGVEPGWAAWAAC